VLLACRRIVPDRRIVERRIDDTLARTVDDIRTRPHDVQHPWRIARVSPWTEILKVLCRKEPSRVVNTRLRFLVRCPCRHGALWTPGARPIVGTTPAPHCPAGGAAPSISISTRAQNARWYWPRAAAAWPGAAPPRRRHWPASPACRAPLDARSPNSLTELSSTAHTDAAMARCIGTWSPAHASSRWPRHTPACGWSRVGQGIETSGRDMGG